MAPPPPVPWRTILAVISAGLAVWFGVVVLRELSRVVTWVVVAGFFAVLLSPAVDLVERRGHVRRVWAALLVFLAGIALFSAMMYTFIRPIVDQAQDFVDDLPELVEDAQAGRGTIGRLVQRYDIESYIQENQARFREGLNEAGAPALEVVRKVFNTLAALLTILVLTFLMLLQGPAMLQSALMLLSPLRRRRVRRVASDCARAISGYMAGNLLISVIAGLATFAFLFALRVRFPGVLALWVAFADLIPLVGATLGAIPTVGVAFLHSVPTGIATVVFFVVYQQFENHVLQVTVMSRTVDLNPLVVLISVLVGVELFGILGALLAIPVAGVLQVIARDVYDERLGRLKPEPTVGTDETPMSRVDGGR